MAASQHYDVNSVAINSDRSHFCRRGRRGFPINERRRPIGVDVSSGLLPPGGNVWAVASGNAYKGFAYAGTAGGGLFRSVRSTAAVRVIPRPRPRPTPAPRP